MTFEAIVLVVGGTLSGLSAGVMYTFSVAIIPALRSLAAKRHLVAAQMINVKIVNPVFMLSFLGPTLLLPLAAYLARNGAQFPLLLAAAALHIIGVNGVTIMGNVPLNDRLAKVEVEALSEADAEQVRQDYQGVGAAWLRLHHVRTWAALAATALVFIACLNRSLPE
jgi:uncharacterized membrane protein